MTFKVSSNLFERGMGIRNVFKFATCFHQVSTFLFIFNGTSECVKSRRLQTKHVWQRTVELVGLWGQCVRSLWTGWLFGLLCPKCYLTFVLLLSGMSCIRSKKKSKKFKSSSSSQDIESDSTNTRSKSNRNADDRIKHLREFLDDRKELHLQLFSIISKKEVKGMMPDILKVWNVNWHCTWDLTPPPVNV